MHKGFSFNSYGVFVEVDLTRIVLQPQQPLIPRLSTKMSCLKKHLCYICLSIDRTDKNEDSRYLSMPVLPDTDPAVYWSGAQKEFQDMAMLARRYFTTVRCNVL